jgi:Flp pilus assembly protein TadG
MISQFPNRNARLRRQGSLTVEVAVCLPLLLTVLFASYELAHANMLLHATESAAYEGARVGIIPGASSDKIEAAVEGILNSVGVHNFEVKVKPKKIKSDTKSVKVELTVPFRANTSIPPFFVKEPRFHGECELSRETL